MQYLKKGLIFFPVAMILLTGLFNQGCRHKISAPKEVRITETELEIPTYLTDTAQINPIFYVPTEYQNAQLHIYPYPAIDKLTDKKVIKKHKAVILENEYLEICILPNLGGRLYYAKDKTNNRYDFFYHNHVIKPALIGMTGAWISGGVEWNIPHHHRASTFMPVDYRIAEDPDGSKTIWVGEYEKRQQTRWTVGLTLHPGKAYLETDIRTFNVTPLPQSGLVWANAAVHANKDYQVIFAPDVQIVTYHAKTDFSEWPISHQIYRGVDYRQGIDISWWKNTKQPTSFFVWHSDMDFFGGIDHGKKGGTVLVGNHHIIPGKKMWNWGNNEVQRMWDQMLTDKDGPYLELMMGAWSDNQPDYSWMEPLSTRFAKMFFYPIAGMDGIKNATKEYAINLETKKDTALVQANATVPCQNCEIILSDGDRVLFQKKLQLDPVHPFSTGITLDENINPFNLKLSLVSAEGIELLSYQPEKIEKQALPKPYTPPPGPEKIDDVCDLYLTGLRLEQFTNPTYDPDAYYTEALKRDPDNFLVNTQMGIRYLKRMNYKIAEQYFRAAREKVTENYTRPGDCEPDFYLGLSLYRQGKYEEAYDELYNAAWNQPCASQAYFLLALMDSKNMEYKKALKHTQRSVLYDAANEEALQLQTMLLRHMGLEKDAAPKAVRLLELDPLNLTGLYEKALLNNNTEQNMQQFLKTMRDEPDNYLEVARRYGRAGFYDDAINVLNLAVRSPEIRLNAYPMIYFYLGYYLDQKGESAAALNHYKKAASLPIDYCFPYGNTSANALKKAAGRLPGAANIYYYLGNIYCDFQPDAAARYWQKAIERDDQKAVYHRNLAFVYANPLNKPDDAAQEIEKAIALNPDDPLYFTEGDRLFESMAKDPAYRFRLLKDHLTTVHGSESSLKRYLILNNFFYHYDTVINILNKRHFHVAEGAIDNPHTYWSDAYRMKGESFLREGKPEKAIPLFNKMLEFPRNLETVHDGKAVLAYYFLARAYGMMGRADQAKENYQKLVDYMPAGGWGEGSWPEVRFYRAKALEALGHHAKAVKIYQSLIQQGRNLVNDHTHSAMYRNYVRARRNALKRKADVYYLQGLGYAGMGDKTRARSMFKKTLDIKPDYLDAKLMIDAGKGE